MGVNFITTVLSSYLSQHWRVYSQMAALAPRLRINLTHYHAALEYVAHIALQADISRDCSSKRPLALSDFDQHLTEARFALGLVNYTPVKGP